MTKPGEHKPATAVTAPDALSLIHAILDENGVMALATIRPDGWPHVTQVSYLRDGLALYFIVARESQKLANIRYDQRVAMALGSFIDEGAARGLSVAGRASEVTDPHRIDHINHLMWDPARATPFRPRPTTAATALIEVTPELISLIDYASFPGRTQLFQVAPSWTLSPAE